jgi:hypothetical protein
MAINSRAKGIRNERAFVNLMKEAFEEVDPDQRLCRWTEISRNWQAQSAIGGHDINALGVMAIEVKANKGLSQAVMWKQAVDQALRIPGSIPVLAHKPMQKPWEITMPLRSVLPPEDESVRGGGGLSLSNELGHSVTMGFSLFFNVVLARKLYVK